MQILRQSLLGIWVLVFACAAVRTVPFASIPRPDLQPQSFASLLPRPEHAMGSIGGVLPQPAASLAIARPFDRDPMSAAGPERVHYYSSARAAFVYDVDAEQVLYAKAADDPRPVASLTKLVSALAMQTESPDLDAVVRIDDRFLPTRSARGSHVDRGSEWTGWDLVGAALVASDNRAAYGMQVVSGLEYDEFIGRMDEVSANLGMERSSWADPSGLEDENLSTARDMTRAILAVAADPTLPIAATSPGWTVQTGAGKVYELHSTNRLVGRDDIEFLAAKTGYTDTAGYCFSAVVRTEDGRTIAFTVLGEGRNKDRWSDAARIIETF